MGIVTDLEDLKKRIELELNRYHDSMDLIAQRRHMHGDLYLNVRWILDQLETCEEALAEILVHCESEDTRRIINAVFNEDHTGYHSS